MSLRVAIRRGVTLPLAPTLGGSVLKREERHLSVTPVPALSLCAQMSPHGGGQGIVLFLAEGTLGWQVGGHLCTVTQGTTHQPSPHDFNGLFCARTQRELFLPQLASWERAGPPMASNCNSNSWAAPTCGEAP